MQACTDFQKSTNPVTGRNCPSASIVSGSETALLQRLCGTIKCMLQNVYTKSRLQPSVTYLLQPTGTFCVYIMHALQINYTYVTISLLYRAHCMPVTKPVTLLVTHPHTSVTIHSQHLVPSYHKHCTRVVPLIQPCSIHVTAPLHTRYTPVTSHSSRAFVRSTVSRRSLKSQ